MFFGVVLLMIEIMNAGGFDDGIDERYDGWLSHEINFGVFDSPFVWIFISAVL